MSSIQVKVVALENVRPHPNADRLELATIGGWQVAVPKGKYTSGSPVVYFEQGTVLPLDVAAVFGVVPYLSQKTDIDGRKVLVVHRVKLRGEPSFGLVIDPEAGMTLGDDVANHYGAVKYQPPVKISAGDADVDHPRFPAYTDIENLRSYADAITDGEQVVLTEKVHGTNARVGVIHENGVPMRMAGSRTLRRKEPADYRSSTYWLPWTVPGVCDLLESLSANGSDVILYGEVYGSGIQSYTYGRRDVGFRAFDLMVDGRYLDFDAFVDACESYGVDICPVVYRGSFSLSAVKAFSDGPSVVGGTHGREGVVVRPVVERGDPKIGRVVLKYVGDAYLFGAVAEQDTTDR